MVLRTESALLIHLLYSALADLPLQKYLSIQAPQLTQVLFLPLFLNHLPHKCQVGTFNTYLFLL